MAKDPKGVLERLIERNPDVEGEDLREAFVEAVVADKEMATAIAADVARVLFPIVEKSEAGKPLTEGERAYMAVFSGGSISDADCAIAKEYYCGLKVQSPHN